MAVGAVIVFEDEHIHECPRVHRIVFRTSRPALALTYTHLQIIVSEAFPHKREHACTYIRLYNPMHIHMRAHIHIMLPWPCSAGHRHPCPRSCGLSAWGNVPYQGTHATFHLACCVACSFYRRGHRLCNPPLCRHGRRVRFTRTSVARHAI